MRHLLSENATEKLEVVVDEDRVALVQTNGEDKRVIIMCNREFQALLERLGGGNHGEYK